MTPLAAVALSAVLASQAKAPEATPPAAELIPASDPRFRYEGRFDRRDAAGPVVVWQASRIRLDFEGTRIALVFGDASGQSFFDVEIDGDRFVVSVPEGPGQRSLPPTTLRPGRHALTLTKRSEAGAGHARFEGVALERGMGAFAPSPPSYKLRVEFFGDSITAGACNEDGAADQWEDRSTHNGTRSYAAFVADALGADFRSTAVSGLGISEGYVPVRAGEVWDRLYPTRESPPADLGSWQPDVAFLNLGENDASFTDKDGRPFPAGFTDGYVALGKAIRAAYPRARLVLLRGGMGNGAQNPALRTAWEAAVARLEAGDPAVSHFVFEHWTRQHPRVADHEAMAAELVAWLRAQGFPARYDSPASGIMIR